MEEFVSDRLRHIKGVDVGEVSSGFVTFSSSLPWTRFQNLRYLNNCFLLLHTGTGLVRGGRGVRSLLERKIHITPTLRAIARNKITFRVVGSVANETIALDPDAQKYMEGQIARGLKLRVSVRAPSVEFWALTRKDGFSYFGVRISSLRKENKEREYGELRSEIAHLMVLLSNPKPTDVVFDPFCGRGGVLFERGYAAPYVALIGADNDPALIADAKNKLSKLKNVTLLHEDSLQSSVKSGSVSKVITDPPWGLYDADVGIDFYTRLFVELERVLRPQGTVVLLSGAKEVLQDVLPKTVFTIEKHYDILVSGKKAGLYKLRKP